MVDPSTRDGGARPNVYTTPESANRRDATRNPTTGDDLDPAENTRSSRLISLNKNPIRPFQGDESARQLDQIHDQGPLRSGLTSPPSKNFQTQAQPQLKDSASVEFASPRRADTLISQTSAYTADSSNTRYSRRSSSTTITTLDPNSRSSTFRAATPEQDITAQQGIGRFGLRHALVKGKGKGRKAFRPPPNSSSRRTHWEDRSLPEETNPPEQIYPSLSPSDSRNISSLGAEAASPSEDGPSDGESSDPVKAAQDPDVPCNDSTDAIPVRDYDEESAQSSSDQLASDLESSHVESLKSGVGDQTLSKSSRGQSGVPSRKILSRIKQTLPRIWSRTPFAKAFHIVQCPHGQGSANAGPSGQPGHAATYTTSGNNSKRNKKGEQKATDPDNGDGNDQQGQQPDQARPSMDLPKGLRFLCIFYAHDKHTYHDCGKFVDMDSISRLKLHLKRCHKRNLTEQQKDLIHPTRFPDTLQSWYTIYSIAFPHAAAVPASAYHDSDFPDLARWDHLLLIGELLKTIDEEQLATLPRDPKSVKIWINHWLQAQLPGVIDRLKVLCAQPSPPSAPDDSRTERSFTAYAAPASRPIPQNGHQQHQYHNTPLTAPDISLPPTLDHPRQTPVPQLYGPQFTAGNLGGSRAQLSRDVASLHSSSSRSSAQLNGAYAPSTSNTYTTANTVPEATMPRQPGTSLQAPQTQYPVPPLYTNPSQPGLGAQSLVWDQPDWYPNPQPLGFQDSVVSGMFGPSAYVGTYDPRSDPLAMNPALYHQYHCIQGGMQNCSCPQQLRPTS